MKELGQDFLSKPNTGCRETSEAFITKVIDSARKLEDKGYIERIINKDNRRKYILKLTKKGEEVIPVLKREVDYWHNSVGLAKISDESMAVIRDVARKSYNLVND